MPRTGGHPFYRRLNQLLDTHAFDELVEAQCAPFYADKIGVGTPRGLQGHLGALLTGLIALWTHVLDCWTHPPIPASTFTPYHLFEQFPVVRSEAVL